MPELDLYEYAVIRVVPRVEREEFMNVGLVMFCKRRGWLRMEFHINAKLFHAFSPEVELNFIEANLKAFKAISEGHCNSSAIATLEVAERFRWLTAVRSSSLQTSRPHVGQTEDLEQTFTTVFQELVL